MNQPTGKTTAQWRQLTDRLEFPSRPYLDGKFCDAQSSATIPSINPANGERLADISAGSERDVDLAVKSANRSFQKGVWADLDPKVRKKTLQTYGQLILESIDELALLETLDMGKPIRDSFYVDIPLVAQCIEWFGELADKLYGETAPLGPDTLATITREPVGVVGAVVPWNFPALMAAWKIGPALAAGNSLVLKPAEQSSFTALKLAELATKAGIPDGVFNVVPGLGETAGRALGMHPEVHAIGFTGSGEVGKLFLRYSSESNMKRVSLECGGKSPCLVFADCGDLEKVASAVAWGIFYNQGEVCNAGSRLLVEESIKPALLEHLVGWAQKIKPGDPLDPQTNTGAIVSQEQFNRVMGFIEQGKKDAKLICGGEAALQDSGGFFVESTIFDEVPHTSSIAREEIFGPVLSVMSFSSESEAIQLANDSEYGLGAGVFSKDISRAHRIAKKLRAGTVWMNCYGDGDITVPFGGYKQSGFGRDKSVHAMDKYSEIKTTWLNLGF